MNKVLDIERRHRNRSKAVSHVVDWHPRMLPSINPNSFTSCCWISIVLVTSSDIWYRCVSSHLVDCSVFTLPISLRETSSHARLCFDWISSVNSRQRLLLLQVMLSDHFRCRIVWLCRWCNSIRKISRAETFEYRALKFVCGFQRGALQNYNNKSSIACTQRTTQ